MSESLKDLKAKIDTLSLSLAKTEALLDQKKGELSAVIGEIKALGIDPKNAKAVMQELEQNLSKNQQELTVLIASINTKFKELNNGTGS